MKIWLHVFVTLCGLFFSACAFDLAHVTYTATQLEETSGSTQSFKLADEVLLSGTPCFSRSLRQHTRWDHVGVTVQGIVFRSKDQVLTLECSNVHEAYIVMSGNELVGFYLPVEQGFVPYSPAIALPVEQETSLKEVRP